MSDSDGLICSNPPLIGDGSHDDPDGVPSQCYLQPYYEPDDVPSQCGLQPDDEPDWVEGTADVILEHTDGEDPGPQEANADSVTPVASHQADGRRGWDGNPESLSPCVSPVSRSVDPAESLSLAASRDPFVGPAESQSLAASRASHEADGPVDADASHRSEHQLMITTNPMPSMPTMQTGPLRSLNSPPPFAWHAPHMPMDTTDEQPEPQEGDGEPAYCEACKMWLNGQTQMEDHKNGKTHKKKWP